MNASAVGRIRERSTFRALRKPMGRASGGFVRASYVPVRPSEDSPSSQVAYVIGRRTGNAVVRNRIRRRLRAAVREAAGPAPAGAYLLGAETAAKDVAYGDLVRAVSDVMHRAGRAKAAPKGPR